MNIDAFLKTFWESTDLYNFEIFDFYLVSRLDDSIRKYILYKKQYNYGRISSNRFRFKLFNNYIVDFFKIIILQNTSEVNVFQLFFMHIL